MPKQLIGGEVILPTKVKVEDILDTPLLLWQIALTRSRKYGQGVRMIAQKWDATKEQTEGGRLVIATFAKGIVSTLEDYLANFETARLELKDGLLVKFVKDGETFILASTTE